MSIRIREARERAGLSQKGLAEELGIKPTTFNGYETGAHDPKSDILKAIAERCNTTVDFLLGLTDDPRGLTDINKKPSEPNEPDSEDISFEEVYNTLVNLFIAQGRVKSGEDMSQEDFAFSKAIIAAISTYFDNH